MQKEININNVKIQVVEDNGIEYYPMSYVFEKALLRKTSGRDIRKSNDYKNYVKKLEVNYGFNTGGIQKVYCINKDGLIKYLKESKIGRLSLEQRQALNGMLKYFGLKCINENKYINTYEIDEYIQDCIDAVIKEDPNIEFKICTTCGHTYPIHKNFFSFDKESKSGVFNMCKICSGNRIMHNDRNLNELHIDYGLEGYILSKHNIGEFYNKYIFKTDKKLPAHLKTKENYLEIIKYLYNKEIINIKNLTQDFIINKLRLSIFSKNINLDIQMIYEFLFGTDYKYYPWKYPSLIQKTLLSLEETKIIFNNYINENNIKTHNQLEFDYFDILSKANIKNNIEDIIKFIVYYNKYQYAGYKFKCKSLGKFRTIYYKDENNRIFDLKYLIEKNMKIPKEKIPLYLTKNSLKKNARSLYELLRKGTYYKNLFEWVDVCYPSDFIEADFVINSYRDEFDSIEESQINDILHNNFDNVIYNQRNTNRTINLAGKIPDWFIFTNKGCYIIEYFGLYVDRENISNNHRINDYRERTDNKLEKYKELDGYKFIALYPDDLNNDFSGIKNKIENII